MDAHLVDEEPVDAVLALELVDLKDALLRAVRPVHHPFKHSQPADLEKRTYKKSMKSCPFFIGKHYTRPNRGWELLRFF